MSGKIEPVYSAYDTYEPYPWAVCEVVPLYDDYGECVAYIETGVDRRIVTELPTEIFNHQLKYLDGQSPNDMAQFMSNYGIFWKPANFNTIIDTHPYAHYVFMVLDKDKEHKSSFESYISKAIDKKFGDYFHDLDKFDLCLIEAHDAAKLLYEFKEFSQYVVMQSARATWGSIAEAEFCSEDEAPDRAIYITERINEMLETYSPKMGFMTPSGRPSFVEYRQDGWHGSFEQALALQLWTFGVDAKRHPEALQVCTECGTVFMNKQSKSSRRKPVGESRRAFCCDRCQSRMTSRENREKIKQNRILQDTYRMTMAEIEKSLNEHGITRAELIERLEAGDAKA